MKAKTLAPVPACCLRPSDRCGYGPYKCSHPECQSYYAPCEKHRAMSAVEKRADYERMAPQC
jgi:hypothetical protein